MAERMCAILTSLRRLLQRLVMQQRIATYQLPVISERMCMNGTPARNRMRNVSPQTGTIVSASRSKVPAYPVDAVLQTPYPVTQPAMAIAIRSEYTLHPRHAGSPAKRRAMTSRLATELRAPIPAALR